MRPFVFIPSFFSRRRIASHSARHHAERKYSCESTATITFEPACISRSVTGHREPDSISSSLAMRGRDSGSGQYCSSHPRSFGKKWLFTQSSAGPRRR
jgi:hypothetical protein